MSLSLLDAPIELRAAAIVAAANLCVPPGNTVPTHLAKDVALVASEIIAACEGVLWERPPEMSGEVQVLSR